MPARNTARPGSCEQVGYDEEARTAAFLCTAKTMDGSPIPTGGKMTFSAGCFLTGKSEQTDVEIPLRLKDYAGDAAAMTPDSAGFAFTDGSSDGRSRVLVPGDAMAVPAEGLTVTAAGFVDGLFHIQLCRGDASQQDNHGWLWLADRDGKPVESLYTAYFATAPGTLDRQDYQEFVFEVSREALAESTLRGDLCTSAARVDGRWRVTFPLRDTFSGAELAKVAEGHSTGSFDPQDTLRSPSPPGWRRRAAGPSAGRTASAMSSC